MWQRIDPSILVGAPPAPRHCHSAVSYGDKVVSFGGTDGKNRFNDVYILDTVKQGWQLLKTKGSTPSQRYCAAIAIHKDHILLLFGGFDATRLNTLHTLDLRTGEWSLVNQRGTIPSARSHHTMVVVGNRAIVFGGLNEDGKLLSDVQVLDLTTMTWSPTQTKGSAPGPRLSHAGVLLNDNILFIFGGYDGKSRLNDTYLLHLDSMTWSEPLYLGKPPSKRFGHGAASMGPLVFVFGGDDGNFDRSLINDIHVFDYTSLKWIQPEVIGESPSGRVHGVVCSLSSRYLYFFAGSGVRKRKYDDVYRLDLDPVEAYQKFYFRDGLVQVQQSLRLALSELKMLAVVAQDILNASRGGASPSVANNSTSPPDSSPTRSNTNNNREQQQLDDEKKSPKEITISPDKSAPTIINEDDEDVLPKRAISPGKRTSRTRKDKERIDAPRIEKQDSSSRLTIKKARFSSTGREKIDRARSRSRSRSRERERERTRSRERPLSRSRSRSTSPPLSSNSSASSAPIAINSHPTPSNVELLPSSPTRFVVGSSSYGDYPEASYVSYDGSLKTWSSPSSPATSPPQSPPASPRVTGIHTILRRNLSSGSDSSSSAVRSSKTMTAEPRSSEHLASTGPPPPDPLLLKVITCAELLIGEHAKVAAQRELAMKSKQNQTQKEQSNRERTSTQEKMVAELIAQQQSKVTLNVGGKFFDTSVSTLTKFPESMFSAMFSGRYTLKAEDDGTFFIDRDGTYFRYVLNYLRYGQDVFIEPQRSIYQDLIQEAAYYQLDGLRDLLHERLSLIAESQATKY